MQRDQDVAGSPRVAAIDDAEAPTAVTEEKERGLSRHPSAVRLSEKVTRCVVKLNVLSGSWLWTFFSVDRPLLVCLRKRLCRIYHLGQHFPSHADMRRGRH